MLILTRRIGESLVIGDNVTMTVLGIKGGQVRLGINAPMTVSIHREEIYEKIKGEKDINDSILNVGLNTANISEENEFLKVEKKNHTEGSINNNEDIQDRRWNKYKKPEERGRGKDHQGRHFGDKNNYKDFAGYSNNFNRTNQTQNVTHSLRKSKTKVLDNSSQNFGGDEDSIGNF